MLDIISKKIMYELFRDGQATNIAIAHKLDLSVVTVAKKINAMMKEGIISIKAIPNPVKMGNYASAFMGLNVDTKKIFKIFEKLKQYFNINMIVMTYGRYDLLILVYFHDWILLENFIKGELPQIEGVYSVNTFFVSEIDVNYRIRFNNVFDNSDNYKLDEMDVQIILELMRNGRPQYSKLATKLGTSLSTISRRISALINEKFISQIIAIPNQRLEYLSNAYIVLNVEYSRTDEICKTLNSYPETHQVMRLMNEYDIIMALRLSNQDELYNFLINKIHNIEGVLKSEPLILANFLYFNSAALIYPPTINLTEAYISNYFSGNMKRGSSRSKIQKG